MAPVIFSLLTEALQQSVSQSPPGEDIKQRKNLSHFIVFYHRELISLFTLTHTVFFLFFLHFSHIPSIHLSSFPAAAVYHFVYLYFIKFDILTMPSECASLSKIQRRQGGRNREKWLRNCRAVGRQKGERWTTVSNLNSSMSDQRDV